jgi:hypothetical protein
MKNFFCALLLMSAVFGGGKVFAQYSNKVWCFGDSAGVIFTNPVSYFTISEAYLTASISIADLNNNLLFYGSSTNATAYYSSNSKRGKLINRNHIKMMNGDSLFCRGWYHDILIIPKSVLDSTFYVFVAGVSGPPYGLYYSIVDLKLQNGLGEVTQKNIQIHTSPMYDGLMAVKHGNGKDWWLVTRHFDNVSQSYNNDFYVYLVDSLGIISMPVQTIGTMRNSGGGDISFNSDGTKMAVSDWGNLIELYDFDRCTGTISNSVNIELPNTSGGPYKYYFSLCFSPNDRFLYVFSNLSIADATIFQFDLTASSIPNSKFIVGTIKDSASAVMMKLAPDNKIYISSWVNLPGSGYPYTQGFYNVVNSNLTVINYPDSLGAACDFQLFSFPLGGHRTYRGLPHNPNYELGAWVGSPCDTLSVGVDDNVPQQKVFFQAWYNSEWNMIHVNASKLKGRTGSLRLFDMEGRLVFEKKIEVIAGGYVTGEIPMNAVVNGVYLVNLITDSESVSSKIVKF